MVSIVILAAIVALLASVFNATTQMWSRSEARSVRHRGARILTDFIGPELRGAMLPVETTTAIGDSNLQLLINPPLKNVPEEYRNPHSIFWQAPIATERSKGDLAEIGYFVKWEQQGSTAVPSLRRFFVNPSVYDPKTKTYSGNKNFLIYQLYDEWLTPMRIEQVAPANKENGYAGLFAENVAGLWIRFYGVDGREITKSAHSSELATEFDSRKGYEYLVKLDSGNANNLGRIEKRYLPLQVTLSIAQVEPQYTQRLATAWLKVRALANAPELRDASQFMEGFRALGETDGDIRALLPGLRIYETKVILENAR